MVDRARICIKYIYFIPHTENNFVGTSLKKKMEGYHWADGGELDMPLQDVPIILLSMSTRTSHNEMSQCFWLRVSKRCKDYVNEWV